MMATFLGMAWTGNLDLAPTGDGWSARINVAECKCLPTAGFRFSHLPTLSLSPPEVMHRMSLLKILSC